MHNDATGRKVGEKADCLPICSSDCLCRLTFHTEFGASAVFVDENKKHEEEDASEACQTNSDGNLEGNEMLCESQGSNQRNVLKP